MPMLPFDKIMVTKQPCQKGLCLLIQNHSTGKPLWSGISYTPSFLIFTFVKFIFHFCCQQLGGKKQKQQKKQQDSKADGPGVTDELVWLTHCLSIFKVTWITWTARRIPQNQCGYQWGHLLLVSISVTVCCSSPSLKRTALRRQHKSTVITLLFMNDVGVFWVSVASSWAP